MFLGNRKRIRHYINRLLCILFQSPFTVYFLIANQILLILPQERYMYCTAVCGFYLLHSFSQQAYTAIQSSLHFLVLCLWIEKILLNKEHNKEQWCSTRSQYMYVQTSQPPPYAGWLQLSCTLTCIRVWNEEEARIPCILAPFSLKSCNLFAKKQTRHTLHFGLKGDNP